MKKNVYRFCDEDEAFLKRLEAHKISKMILLDVVIFDEDLCDAKQVFLLFEDGVTVSLVSQQKSEEEWDFAIRHHEAPPIAADDGVIKPLCGDIGFLSLYSDDAFSELHYLDLSVDDAVLCLHAEERCVTVGIIALHGISEKDGDRRRTRLFQYE